MRYRGTVAAIWKFLWVVRVRKFGNRKREKLPYFVIVQSEVWVWIVKYEDSLYQTPR